MSRRLLAAVALLPLAVGCGNPQPPAPPPAQPGLPAKPGDPTPAPPAEESESVRKYKLRVKELGEAAEAGRISLILELLKGGADVNDKDDAGRTALHKAATKGQQGACVALLAHGADAGEKDGDGVTPLMLAAGGGHTRILQLMLSPGEVTTAAGDVLKEAAKGVIGDAGKFAEKLTGFATAGRDAADKQGQTAVHKAAAGGHAGCLGVLVALNTEDGIGRLARPDRSGKTPLMLAAANGHAGVFEFLRTGKAAAAAPLVLKTPDGQTAFDLARDGKHKEVVAHLDVLRPLAAAAAGDVDMLEQAYKADPAKFPAANVVAVAVRTKNLPVLKKALDLLAGKSSAEKSALLRSTPSEAIFPIVYDAVELDWPDGVAAMVDAKWWNDGPGLKAFIQHRSETFSDLLSDYTRVGHPKCHEALKAAFDAAEPKK